MSEWEQSVRTLDPVGDTWLAVRHHADGLATHPRKGVDQDILVEATPLGQRLARLLAAMHGADEPEAQQVGRQAVLAVPHSPELDEHLVQLIDLLIELRWAHPRLVQLELVLPVPSQAEGSAAEGLDLGDAEAPA